MEENVPDEAIFKKSYFSLLWFSLKQILGSEPKHLSRHRLLVVDWIGQNLMNSPLASQKHETWCCLVFRGQSLINPFHISMLMGAIDANGWVDNLCNAKKINSKYWFFEK